MSPQIVIRLNKMFDGFGFTTNDNRSFSIPCPLFGTASEIEYLCRVCTTYENGL